MAKKPVEKIPILVSDKTARAPLYNFGSRSSVSGETYVDPNGVNWEAHFRKKAEQTKQSNDN